MDWREIFGLLTGIQVGYLPLAIASLTLFCLVFALCFSMHRLSQLLPQKIRVIAQDYFKTLAFCTYPFGLMIVRRYYGDLGYVLCNVPLNTATTLILAEGQASPIANWLLFVKKKQSFILTAVRSFVQITAGLSAFRLGKLLMRLDLHPTFAESLFTECVSALNVPVFVGFFIELFGTTWDLWFHSLKLQHNVVIDKLLKFCNSSVAVCLVGHTTGLFREPAKAIGLTFGCKGISSIQHILIYSLAPILGSYLAYRIKPTIGPVVESDNSTTRTSSDEKQGIKRRKKNKRIKRN